VTMLEKGQSDDIYSAIRQAGNEAYWGMQTMNQCLLRFYKAGLITEQDALANAGQFTELRQMIRMAFNKGEVANPTANNQAAMYQQKPQQAPGPQVPGIPPMPPRRN